MSTKNSNCLYGMQCPRCLHEDMFYITATVVVEVSDDGTGDIDSTHGHYWDEGSECSCPQCSLFGTVKDFNDWGQRYTPHALEKRGLYMGRHGLYDLYYLPADVVADSVGRYICRMGHGLADIAIFREDYVIEQLRQSTNSGNETGGLFLELKTRKEWRTR